MNKLQQMKHRAADALSRLEVAEKWQGMRRRMRSSGKRRRRGTAGLAAIMFVALTLIAYDLGSGGQLLPQKMPLPTVAQQQNQQQEQQEQQVTPTAADAYYAEYRLLREQSRAEELELLDEVIEDEDAGEAVRDEAAGRKTQLAQRMEAENQAEAMLAARDYGTSLVMIGDEQVTVVISAPLDDNAALVAAQLVGETTGRSWQDVVIIERE